MASTEIRQQVLDWIADGCDWDKGILLYSKHGKNQALIKNIAGKKSIQSSKLIYELCKSVGLDYQKLKSENQVPVLENEDPVKTLHLIAPKQIQVNKFTAGETDGVSMPHINKLKKYPLGMFKITQWFRNAIFQVRQYFKNYN